MQRGFTLVEMTIVAAIFGILTAIVVYKYGDFTSNLLVTNMAYEIALTTRQAQSFGLGVRGYEFGGDRDFDNPYGVFFNLSDGSTPQENQTRNFILFVDRDDDSSCNNGDGGESPCTCVEGDECIDKFTMQRNIRITNIEVGNGTKCYRYEGTVLGAITSVAVSFKRPSPESRIKINIGQDNFPFTQLKIEAPGSDINPSYVLIRNNGQISVSSNNICDNGYTSNA